MTRWPEHNAFTLLEVVIGIGVLAAVSVAIYSLFSFSLKVAYENKARTTASALANEKVELIRNLPYNDVGTTGGIPTGVLLPTETVTRNNITYTVQTDIFYIDDEFDGRQGGLPDDPLPTDYKRVRIAVSWLFRLTNQPVIFVTDIAPPGIETEQGGGTIDISVSDAAGQPVAQADVQIVNYSVFPAINLSVVTDSNGHILIPGAPAAIEAYEIVVTKTGYSVDRTYGVDPLALPSPVRSHLTVLEGYRTEASFAIDQVASLAVTTVNAEGTACELSFNSPGTVRLAQSGPVVHTYSIGTLSQTVTAASVTGLDPWLLQLDAPADIAAFATGDKFTDEVGMMWKITAVDDDNDIITLTDSEENVATPSSGSGTISRWYSHIQAWADGRQGDLVGRAAVEKGLLYKDSFMNENIVIEGSVTDADHYLWLTVADSALHAGLANTGAIISPVTPGHAISVADSYTRISGLEITRWASDSAADYAAVNVTADQVFLENLIIHDDNHGLASGAQADGIQLNGANNTLTIKNSLLYNLADWGIVANQGSGLTLNIVNTTVFSCLAAGTEDENLGCIGGPSQTSDSNTYNLTNVIAMSQATDGVAFQKNSSSSWGNSDYNMSDDASAPGTNFLRQISPANVFVYGLAGNENFHLSSTAGYYPFGPSDISTSNSLALDMGQPAADYSLEPSPNGCRINLGAFGNTPQASKTPQLGAPLANVNFSLQGAKIIGRDAFNNKVYKYHQDLATDTSGSLDSPNMEWDSYKFIVDPLTGFDVAYIDPPQPVNLLPLASLSVELGLVSDADDTLKVFVADVDGQPLDGATVTLSQVPDYDKSILSAAHGQVFFTPLGAVTYNLAVAKPGFDSYAGTVDVSGYTEEAITLVVSGSPPPPPPGPENWWHDNYTYRRQITILNNDSAPLPPAWPVNVVLNHSSWVSQAKAQATGNDVRIVYDAGSSFVELARLPANDWNQVDTSLWFSLQTIVPSSGSDSNYWVYYGYSGAGAGPADWNEIFQPKLEGGTKLLYHFEDGAGLSVTDTANSHTGTLTNMDDNNWQFGKFSRALDFGAGTLDNYVSGSDAADLHLLSGTLQFYFELNDLDLPGQSEQTLFSKDREDFGSGGHLTINWLENEQRIRVRLQSTTASYYVYGPVGNIAAGEWHHLAFIWGSGGMKLYQDNALVDTNTYGGGLQNNYEPYYLGAGRQDYPSSTANNFMSGSIDGLSVSATVLQSFPGVTLAAPGSSMGFEESQ